MLCVLFHAGKFTVCFDVRKFDKMFLKARLLPEDIRRINEECIAKTGIDKHIVYDAIRSATPPENNKLYKEYLNCSYLKQGYQNAKGDILYENIKEFLSQYYTQEQLRQSVDSCAHIKGGTPAENAFKALICILENLKALTQNENEIE